MAWLPNFRSTWDQNCLLLVDLSSRRTITHTHTHTEQHHMAAQVCCQQPVYKVLLKHGPTGALTYTLCIYGCWHFACLQTLDGEYLSCKHCIWRQRARATRWILLVEQHNPFWKSNRKRQEPKTFYLSELFWALWNIYIYIYRSGMSRRTLTKHDYIDGLCYTASAPGTHLTGCEGGVSCRWFFVYLLECVFSLRVCERNHHCCALMVLFFRFNVFRFGGLLCWHIQSSNPLWNLRERFAGSANGWFGMGKWTLFLWKYGL